MITDVSRMGEWSPETYKAAWLNGASGPAVGARFRGWNRHGPLRWSTRPRVTDVEPGRVFEFDTGMTKWRYEFRPLPDGSGTEVVESFETRAVPGYDVFLAAFRRQPSLIAGALRTLERLKASAEAEAGATDRS